MFPEEVEVVSATDRALPPLKFLLRNSPPKVSLALNDTCELCTTFADGKSLPCDSDGCP